MYPLPETLNTKQYKHYLNPEPEISYLLRDLGNLTHIGLLGFQVR